MVLDTFNLSMPILLKRWEVLHAIWCDSEESKNTEKVKDKLVSNHIALYSLTATKCFTTESVATGLHLDDRSTTTGKNLFNLGDTNRSDSDCNDDENEPTFEEIHSTYKKMYAKWMEA